MDGPDPGTSGAKRRGVMPADSVGASSGPAASERVAVVPPGGGAIGSAIADALRDDGLRVAVVDRAGDITADLSSESSARAAAAAVIERYRRCDVLAHCAAAFDQSDLAHLDAVT
jgi:NAD(P)-dependent dehydrogenase (short-subunit alcohol dehydrogenase family)